MPGRVPPSPHRTLCIDCLSAKSTIKSQGSDEKVNMLIKVNLKSQRTKDSIRHLIGAILKQKPLWSGKTIEVVISENSPIFPDVVQLSGEEGGKEYERLLVSTEKTPWVSTLFKIDPQGNKSGYAENDLKFERMGLATKYFSEQLKDMCKFKNSYNSLDGSSSFVALLEIENLDKLREKAKKLGVRVIEGETIELDSNLEPSELKHNPLRIHFAGKDIKLTEGTIQSRVCEIMFNQPLDTMFEMMDLTEAIYNTPIDEIKKKRKRIYNALYLINERIEEITGKRIFKLGTVRLYRIA